MNSTGIRMAIFVGFAIAFATILAFIAEHANPRSTAQQQIDYSLLDQNEPVNLAHYTVDYSDCQTSVKPIRVHEGTSGTPIAGALLWGIIGNSICGKNCASIGTLSGYAVGSAIAGYKNEMRKCLVDRGYKILSQFN